MNRRVLAGLCAVAVFVLDQGSKALALKSPGLHAVGGVEVLPFLNLVFVRNDGVSFGMLGGIVPWWGLVLPAATIVAWLLIWLWRVESRLTAAALGLVIGGALGNILDRVRYQAVSDFLDLHFGPYHWPSFNLADTAIFFGVVLLLWANLRATKYRPKTVGEGDGRDELTEQ